MIYICIPVFDRIERTIACLESIYEQTYPEFKVVVCDHSPDGLAMVELKHRFSEVVWLRGDSTMWWTAATNRCVEYVLAHGNEEDYIFTLNNDTVLDQQCLLRLINAASTDTSLIIGCVNLIREQGEPRIEPSAQIRYNVAGFSMYSNADSMRSALGTRNGMRRVDTLSGKGVLIPCRVFKKIGLYNETVLPHYHADTEFSVRASRSGYALHINYGARLYSWTEETGLNARNTNSNLFVFFKGFTSMKSTRHLPSLIGLNKLLYGKTYPFYLLLNLGGIGIGFVKRAVKRLRR